MRRLVALLLCLLAAATPAAADTLRIGVNTLPVSRGDPFKGNGRPGTLVWYALYDGLTRLDEQGRLAPALATRWTMVTPTRWRFDIRRGVRYSNGRPFDAATAAAVLNWLAGPGGKKTVVGNELRTLDKAMAAGPFELIVETNRPDPILPKRLIAALMVEPRAWAERGPADFAFAPVGTGPYRLAGWDQRRRTVTLVRNPYAWRRGAMARLEFVELPDAAVRTQALLSRDVDIAPVEIEEIDRLHDRRVPTLTVPSMSVMSIALINQRPGPSPLKDQRVRQALNLAVDREALARVLLRGYGRPASQPAPRGSFGHDPTLPPLAHDPARARKLLAEAGYPNGFPLTIEVQTNAFPADSLIFQSVASDLRKIGVRPTIRVITLADYLRKLGGNLWTVDAFGATWNSAPYNDVTRPMESFSCKRPKPFFCDKAVAGELSAATARLDEREREAALKAMARRYREVAPALLLVEQIDIYGHQPDLAGVGIANRVPVWENIKRKGPAS
ncbi:MAG: hypothetical protein INF91_02900 [Alphaproteobacteria bacterium]|nr:hypothetical protein [Alphaproteobacteria bacterium]